MNADQFSVMPDKFDPEPWDGKFHLNKTYMWYTTCPKCAGKYGKNCVVVLAEVA
jgi:hypothetical protein